MPDPDPLAFGVDLESVRARVEALGTFLLVGDIQAAEEALNGRLPFTPPAAFVSIVNEQASPNKLIGGYSQEVAVRVSVLFAIKSQRAAEDTRDEMERTRKAIMRQCVGWQPEGAGKALGFDRYLIRVVADGLCWGEVLFLTRYRFTQ